MDMTILGHAGAALKASFAAPQKLPCYRGSAIPFLAASNLLPAVSRFASLHKEYFSDDLTRRCRENVVDLGP